MDLKVLHLIPFIDSKKGGAVFALFNILKLEKRLGINSTVISMSHGDNNPTTIDSTPVVLLQPTFPKRFSRSKFVNDWLKRNGRNFDLAVFHTVWNIFQFEATRILNSQGIPCTVWPHGSLDPFDLKKKSYLKKVLGPLFVRPLLDRFRCLVCASSLESERIEKYGSRTKTKVLSLPVSPLLSSGDRERFRKRFGLDDRAFVFLFLSRIDYKKGLNLLIPAIKTISEDFSKVRLVIAGSGTDNYREKVRAWIHEYDLGKTVIMSGFLSGRDKEDALAGSDCFVLPSMNENFGIAVVEALSGGLPVLISDNVYIYQEIAQGGGGWVCKYSIESLAATITHILTNPSDLREKKEKARSSAHLFSLQNLEGSYKEFYRQFNKMKKSDHNP